MTSVSCSVSYEVPGLDEPVEILVDRWGVPHLYAASRGDLFLAQGFNAARDRLFQLDLWRRRGLGLLSEVFGEEYLAHDRAARLFLYRGDMAREWEAYGPGTEEMTRAFVAGVNAFVELCGTEEHRALTPPEFGLLGYGPARWEAEDVARIRSHGLFYNLHEEVTRALTLRDFGPEVEELRRVREPAPHALRVPEGLDLSVIPDNVLDVYRLATTPPWAGAGQAPRQGLDGSNNWVLAPSRTATGRPLLANDPHRAVTLPALRYLAHLSAPGLDVIGAGEPALPGVSIGHNGRIAFGLTIFPVDQEDLYVYRTDPADPRRYAYGDGWEAMERVVESVPVRGRAPVETELWFTRHGPVVRESPERNAAFAVRAAWLEPGMAPYLGSAGYMDAEHPEAFTSAMRRWGAPGENQVYAAPDGTVGWRPAGRVPVRRGWDGTLPVPGDGRYEWDGHHAPEALPAVRDPESGWFATANQLNLPEDYPNDERTVTYDWYAPTRHDRIAEALAARDDWTAWDCVRLQNDYVSLPARAVLRLLPGLAAPDDEPDGREDREDREGSGGSDGVRTGLALLRGWDADLRADSAPGALFEVWYRRHLRPALLRHALRGVVPEERIEAALARILPDENASADARVDMRLLTEHADDEALPPLLLRTLADAVAETERLLGPDTREWAWGRLHRALPRHPLSSLLANASGGSGDGTGGGTDGSDGSGGPGAGKAPDARDTPDAPAWASLGPAPRGGSGDTVGATAGLADFRQHGGATFRMVVDVGSWDDSLVMNSPGQSGVPGSPHYSDLFEAWAADSAFPLVYTRERVERETAHTVMLRPPARD